MGTVSVSLPSDGTTADVADYNTPITTIVNAINGNLDNTNIASGAAITGSKLADASIDIATKASANSGWVGVSDSWSYSSWTAGTRIGVITVPTDGTAKYSAGMKIKITQSTGGVKYGFITAVATTTLTAFFGLDYTLNNEAISSISYSIAYAPLGYNGPILTLEAYQSITTDTMRWTFEQHGWTFVTGDASNLREAITITYPVAYAGIPIVTAGLLGNKAGSNPTTPGDFTAVTTTFGDAGWGLDASAASATTVVLTVNKAATAFGTTNRLGLAWTAKGPVT